MNLRNMMYTRIPIYIYTHIPIHIYIYNRVLLKKKKKVYNGVVAKAKT